MRIAWVGGKVNVRGTISAVATVVSKAGKAPTVKPRKEPAIIASRLENSNAWL
jgi:hypothetical protein